MGCGLDGLFCLLSILNTKGTDLDSAALSVSGETERNSTASQHQAWVPAGAMTKGSGTSPQACPCLSATCQLPEAELSSLLPPLITLW